MIQNITLKNFRNFEEKKLSFLPDTNVIIAPNATGKTNILEAVYLLSTGKSFKASLEAEMIFYKSDVANISGQIQKDGDVTNLMVILTRGENVNGGGGIMQRKKVLVNNVSKRVIDFAGNLKVTLFGPWDMDLVTGSPSLRRKFLDMVLSQADREYRRCLLSYEKGLRQRNRLLWRIREEGLSRSQLLFWDRLLIKNGDYISSKREEFVEYVNEQKIADQELHIHYDKSAISETRIEQYRYEEVSAATTLVGPHRDDFQFYKTEDRNLSLYGSRGEQRMGVLWLKLAELSFIEKVTGEIPTLLLDDIFSELDHEHREIVMNACVGRQTILTTADPHYAPETPGVYKIILNE